MIALSRHRRGAVTRMAATALAVVAWSAVGPAGAVPATAASAAAPPATTAGATSAAAVGPARADAVRDEQWQLKVLNARTAWRLSTGKGVTVAVIDSGVDASHPDLVGQVLPGVDLVRASGDGHIDPVGHGTTVAALIAGRDDDRRGVVGLAPDARILPVRVLDEENRYDDALIVAKAVRWAVDHGAQVVNLSLGGAGDSPALASAIDYAFARDVVVVACTGNLTSSGPVEVWYPAREPGVVAVAGLERGGDRLWSGSLTGDETVLTAPATGLLGARPGGYWRVQGTSFAAPLVAATAALIRARWPDMSAADVVNRLLTTARDLGPAGRDPTFGFGRVDPVAALDETVSGVSRNPLDDASSPAVVGFGPAPGLDAATASPAPRPTGLGGRASSVDAGWVLRPTASTAGGSVRGHLAAVALLLAVAAGGTLLIRRRPR